jgi:cell wall-associated NlpC family hydrolase
MSLEKKKSFISIMLTFVLIFSICFTLVNRPAEAVSKAELDALKQQQAQLADKKADLQKQAAAIDGQVNSQTERLNLLNEQLDLTISELINLSDQIAVYTNTIAELENELNANEQKEHALLAQYRVRMRAMEEAGPIAYIAVLFESNSFADLLSRINTVRDIMAYDNELIKDVQDTKDKVAQSKADMESEMADQQIVFTTYQDTERDLLAQQNEVQAILTSLSADSADYQKQLETVATLQSSIGAQISDMQNKLAEQERIKAEQAAALKAAQEKAKWYNDAPSSGTGTGQDIVDYAKSFLGVPYVYGGTSPKGFDCSGLVYYCYAHYGYSINRTASGQALNGTLVSPSELKAGDVIIFSDRGGKHIGHCGIYIGDGKFIHAPHTGDVVKISSLSDTYYKNHYWSARRIIND